MGRRPWATPEQVAFLKGFIGQLEEEKHNHGLVPFYARVADDFIKCWEFPIPSDVDMKKVTEPSELKRLADKRRAHVSPLPPLFHPLLISTILANH